MSSTNGQNGTSEAATPALDAFFEKRDEVVSALRGLGDVASSLGTRTLQARIDRELVEASWTRTGSTSSSWASSTTARRRS